MPRTIPLAQYIFRRLHQINCKTIHGVPGDFFLRSLDHIQPAGVSWIGNANELCAGYAADGYARVASQIAARRNSDEYLPLVGALYTTYGVGELSAINAIAGSYAEHIPVVHLVGTASREAMRSGSTKRVVHHSLGDGNMELFAEMAKNVTCGQAYLHRLSTATEAAEAYDEVLEKAVKSSRPVYVSLPSDLVEQHVAADMLHQTLDFETSTVTAIEEDNLIEKLTYKICSAETPLIIADGLSYPLQVRPEINNLISFTNISAMCLTSGKGIVDESSPAWSPALPNTTEYSQNPDLVLHFGPLLADTNTARWSALPDVENTVYFHPDAVEMDGEIHRGVHIKERLRSVILKLKAKEYHAKKDRTQSTRPRVRTEPLQSFFGPIRQDEFWPAMSGILQESDTVLLANGTPLIGGRALKLPKESQMIASSIFCSIGHMLPAAQGVAAAKRDHGLPGRTIVFEGDGSFQVTCQSVSDIIRYRLNVTIVIVNNAGYTYERWLHGMKADYNDVPSWRYIDAASFFGARSDDPAYPVFKRRVETWSELVAVMEDQQFIDGKGLQIIDVVMDPEDVPEASKPGLRRASGALR